MDSFKNLWKKRPLLSILLLAFVVRLGSVIFSKGYGMHDDHFLIIESSKMWADGINNDWLPKEGVENQQPSGHSFFYVGLHYLLFVFFKFVGIVGAQSQMYIIRLLHALLSLITVYCGYKIANKIAGEAQARVVGLLLAFYWMMPFLSVRNLVEVVSIVPLMAASWLVIKNDEHEKTSAYVWAGLLLGIAFSIRFQTVLFSGGFGLALLFLKRIKPAFVLGLVFLATAAATQGITDFYIWGKPFVEFQEYVRYNIENANSYSTQPWYLYVLFLSGILIPPVSLFLLFGFLKNWKKHLLLFLPSFVFLLFHSYFPNKQERFILPIIPFIITLGYVGWDEFVNHSAYWAKHTRALKNSWRFFIALNSIALLVVSFAYTKRNRVEAMSYLSTKEDVRSIVIEDSNRDGILMPPLFYMQKWVPVYGVTQLNKAMAFSEQYKTLPDSIKPNYVVFMQEENMDARVKDLKTYFPSLTYQTTIEPSYIDKLMHWLNPVNKNQITYIYKIN